MSLTAKQKREYVKQEESMKKNQSFYGCLSVFDREVRLKITDIVEMSQKDEKFFCKVDGYSEVIVVNYNPINCPIQFDKVFNKKPKGV